MNPYLLIRKYGLAGTFMRGLKELYIRYLILKYRNVEQYPTTTEEDISAIEQTLIRAGIVIHDMNVEI